MAQMRLRQLGGGDIWYIKDSEIVKPTKILDRVTYYTNGQYFARDEIYSDLTYGTDANGTYINIPSRQARYSTELGGSQNIYRQILVPIADVLGKYDREKYEAEAEGTYGTNKLIYANLSLESSGVNNGINIYAYSYGTTGRKDIFDTGQKYKNSLYFRQNINDATQFNGMLTIEFVKVGCTNTTQYSTSSGKLYINFKNLKIKR